MFAREQIYTVLDFKICSSTQEEKNRKYIFGLLSLLSISAFDSQKFDELAEVYSHLMRSTLTLSTLRYEYINSMIMRNLPLRSPGKDN